LIPAALALLRAPAIGAAKQTAGLRAPSRRPVKSLSGRSR
jgi:hypothetical protein